MGQRDSGSIGRVSEALNGSKTGGQTSGMNIATFDEFDPYSNSYKKYDQQVEHHQIIDSGRGKSYNKNGD